MTGLNRGYLLASQVPRTEYGVQQQLSKSWHYQDAAVFCRFQASIEALPQKTDGARQGEEVDQWVLDNQENRHHLQAVRQSQDVMGEAISTY